MGCLSSCSYIKPQQNLTKTDSIKVVYHLVPTSNHNCRVIMPRHGRLFIILFLHQTTTRALRENLSTSLFIILFLHQTTTRALRVHFSTSLFIILFLHQTTTTALSLLSTIRCLSSCSYIKPQPIAVNLLAISKILCFKLLRNGRAGRILLQKY